MKTRFAAFFILLLLLAGCDQSTAGGESGEPAPEGTSDNPSEVIPDDKPKDSGPLPPLDRVVFYEIVNNDLGEYYNGLTTQLINTLHGQYIWPGKDRGLNYYSGDSTVESLFRFHPAYSFPSVHKFFSVKKVNELRFGDVIKIRLTWMEKAEDGRLRARFKLYKNVDHKWKAAMNPGEFTFPGDGAFPEGSLLPTEKEMMEIVKSTLVRLTYK